LYIWDAEMQRQTDNGRWMTLYTRYIIIIIIIINFYPRYYY